jgi:uncharacterized protein YybS (DUF2232 family)
LWGLLAFLLAGLLFLTLEMIPLLGLLVGGFTLTPLALILMEKGRHFFHIGNLMLAGLLLVGWGVEVSVFYLFGFALSAILLGELLQRGRGVGFTVMVSTLVPLMAGGGVIAIQAIGQGEDLLETSRQQIQNSLSRMMDFYQASGMDPEKLREFRDAQGGLAQFLLALSPSLMFVSSLFIVLSNYLLIRSWIVKKRDQTLPAEYLSEWHLPDHAVWGVIGAGFLLLVPHTPSRIVGGNLLLILLVLYLLQGMALMVHFFRRKRLSVWVQTSAFLLLIFWPILLSVVLLGLADVWLDFRKVRGSPSGSVGSPRR